jgi:hypothetical protein
MPYQILATSNTPALIIYLLDISASMAYSMGDKRRIDIVSESFVTAIRQMVFRSTKGKVVSPRYRIAIYAYSDSVYDVLGGIKTIAEVASFGGIPELRTERSTETAKAFKSAANLLAAELPRLQNCPAPLVCHMTDGEFTGEDPEPIVRRIMQIAVPDGNVLVENIFISEKTLPGGIRDPQHWEGILPATQLDDESARKVRSISSPLPETYRAMMLESNYNLAPGAVMMLPGISQELVSMGFQMSAATPIK